MRLVRPAQQREEGPGPDPPEEQQVDLHDGRPHQQRAIEGAPLLDAGLCGQSRGALGRVTSGRVRLAGPPGAADEVALRDPGENVLDEGADDRRVVRDAFDPEARRLDDGREVVVVDDGIDVIGFAQALLPQIDQPETLTDPRESVDETPTAGQPFFLTWV
jgi:hypothetical protein